MSQWLKKPQVSRWYDDPNYIEGLEDHLEDNKIRMQVVLYQGSSIAPVKDYDIHGLGEHHLSDLPRKSRGIDTFIAQGEWIGKSHGTNYLSILDEQLFTSGIPALGIDPHPENIIARKVYQKVGFTGAQEVESQYSPIRLMIYRWRFSSIFCTFHCACCRKRSMTVNALKNCSPKV